MKHKVCREIEEWISREILQQIENCIEQDCNWWCLCCNKWFCFLAWIVVVVVDYVVHLVCEIIAIVIDFVVNVLEGIWNVIAGIFTGDWDRVVDGLSQIFVQGFGGYVVSLARIATLGDAVGFFKDQIDKWSLRDYVRDKVREKYQGRERDEIFDNLGLGSRNFGFRLHGTAVNTFIRSDSHSMNQPLPDLLHICADQNIDPKVFAGFESSSYFQRMRRSIEADGGGDFDEDDFNAYVANGGGGTPFSLFAMEGKVFEHKVDTATQKFTELGIILKWHMEDRQVSHTDLVVVDQDDFPDFLTHPAMGRTSVGADAAKAKAELCRPFAVAVFRFQDLGENGHAAHSQDATCHEGGTFEGDFVTGAGVRDREPDWVWRWVLAHELGHTFGLCHVDGLDQMMVNTKTNNALSWSLLPNYWLNGEPTFSHDDAKQAWDYIIANFAYECLAGK